MAAASVSRSDIETALELYPNRVLRVDVKIEDGRRILIITMTDGRKVERVVL